MLLGRLHHLLEGLAVVDVAISVAGRDATGQDTGDKAVVAFED
jgi:hypothetical protein